MRAVLGAFLGLMAMASPAFADSGAGNYTNTGIFSGLTSANGIYFSAYAPDPDLGPGARSMTHTRLFFNRGAFWFNGAGFISADSRSNRRLGYQISDSNGFYTYFVSNYSYSLTESNGSRGVVSAGMWQASGNTWHFNWWGPRGLNVGIDAYNNVAYQGPNEAAFGGEAWGGCSSYPSNYAWNWMYRNRYNGYWYYMPATGAYNWGGSPWWSINGNGSYGGSINFGTTGC